MTGPRIDNGELRLDGFGRELRAAYAPEVVTFDGLGQWYGYGPLPGQAPLPAPTRTTTTSGWDPFGKPQSWYDRVTRVQKELQVLLAEVTGFGAGVWNTISAHLSGAPTVLAAAGLRYFANYDWTVNALRDKSKSILVTATGAPTDATVDAAENWVGQVRPQVEYAKRIVPEAKAEVAAGRAAVEANLVSWRLRSPAEAGNKEFVRSMEEGLSKLGGLGMGLGLAVAGLAALFLFSRGGARLNPRRRRHGGWGGKLHDAVPYAMAGYLAYSVLKK